MGAKGWTTILVSAGLLLGSACAPQPAQEPKPEVTDAQVRQAIADYIQGDAELKGGFYLYDPEAEGPVELEFDYVHEGVTRTEAGQYFACVDMRRGDGAVYDLDVYLEESEEGLRPARVVIHKVDGEERN